MDDSATTLISEAEFCVFDLETSGVDPARGDDIVQIGAVKIAAARLSGEAFETLVDCGRSIPARATRVDGITRGMVQGAPPPYDAIARLEAFAGDAGWAAFAAGFDIGFLRLHQRRLPPILRRRTVLGAASRRQRRDAGACRMGAGRGSNRAAHGCGRRADRR